MKKFLGVLGILTVIIVLQNWQSINLQILFWQIRISQVLLLVIILLSGLGLGFVLGKKT